MDIIKTFVQSKEMQDYYRNNPLSDQQLIQLIINAPESISDKQLALRSLLPSCDEETSALINEYIMEIDDALHELLHLDGAILNLTECWYDDAMLSDRISSAIPFTSYEAALDYVHLMIVEEQWDDNTTCWTTIEKWVPSENGNMIWTYKYTLINDKIVGFKNWDKRKCEKTYQWVTKNYLDADLNLPIPFKPGDIVALDCRPFAPVKPALILEVGDDCCGAQILFRDELWNKYDVAALKHGEAYASFRGDYYIHPLSYLYRLRTFPVDFGGKNILFDKYLCDEMLEKTNQLCVERKYDYLQNIDEATFRKFFYIEQRYYTEHLFKGGI